MGKKTFFRAADKELFSRSLELWGPAAQIDMAIEEMSELTKALCKYKRGAHKEASGMEGIKSYMTDLNKAKSSVREEIADVMVMMGQMLKLFGEERTLIEYGFKIRHLEQLITEHEERMNGPDEDD